MTAHVAAAAFNYKITRLKCYRNVLLLKVSCYMVYTLATDKVTLFLCTYIHVNKKKHKQTIDNLNCDFFMPIVIYCISKVAHTFNYF